MSLFPSAFETTAGGPSTAISLSAGAAGNKRKRASLGGGNSKDDQLRATTVNLAKLMDKVERGDVKEKSGREPMGHMGKKKKHTSAFEDEEPAPFKGKGKGRQHQQQAKGKQQQGKKQQQQPQGKKQKQQQQQQEAKGTPTKKDKSKNQQQQSSGNRPAPVELALPEIPKGADAAEDEAGLTDMQRQMRSKLEGARFRWINEQLYSTASTDAVAMMKKDPKIFADYHNTHRQLTAGWPSPPLPHIVNLLAPLPRGTVIVDLGCGDAGLARALVPQGKVVLSYDLVGDSGLVGNSTNGGKGVVGAGGAAGAAGEGWVVECDFLSRVPLPGRPGGLADTVDEKQWRVKETKKTRKDAAEVVDAVVCCLSLMGTNWLGGVYEAARVLKHGGTYHVAEVTSRFVDTDAFVEAICSFGFALESQEEPSTHFTLFRFTKRAAVPQGPARGEAGWDARLRGGEELLRACVYKKR